MTDPITQSLGQTLSQCREFLNRDAIPPDPNAGFAMYVGLLAGESTHSSSEIVWPTQENLRHPPALAYLGFLSALQLPVPDDRRQMWIDSINDVLNREPFPLDRQSFTFRPIEVLGVSLGGSSFLESDSECWGKLCRIVERCAGEGNTDVWSHVIYAISSNLLGCQSQKSDSISMPHVDEWNIDHAAMVKWLSTFDSGIEFEDQTITQAEDKLLTECLLGNFKLNNAAKAAVLIQAISSSANRRIAARLAETQVRPANTAQAIDLVVSLCERFPLFARQLRVRRKDVKVDGGKLRASRPTIEMTDEYDVQDSLHAILKLFFDDVRTEEWTPSYAGNQNRVDFVLPEELIVIEAKFFGEKMTRRKVVEQLIIDKEYYRHIDHCETLICIVYDPETRCDNPAALVRDVSATAEDGLNVVVIVCPSGL